MINLAHSWRRVVGSGHFITWPVFPVTGALAVTAMGPLVTLPAKEDPLPAAGASVAAWAVFAAILVLAALLERTLSSRRLRAVCVLSAIGIASVARPFVQDWLMTAWGAYPPEADQRGVRVITNVIVWTVVISVIAVAADAERNRRQVNRLLRQALSQLQTTGQRAAEFDRAARESVSRCAQELGDEFATWAAHGRVDPTLAAAASEKVRSSSHALADEAHNPLPPAAATVPGGLVDQRRPRLRLPPVGLVSVIYLLVFLPYGIAQLSAREVLSSLVVLAVCGWLADLLPRRLPHRYLPRRRPALFLALAVVVGAALTLNSVLMGHRGGVTVLFPVIAYPTFALAASLCYGLMNSRRVAERRLNTAVAQASRSARLSTADARTALLTASGLLHRDLQAACVLLAHDPTDTARLEEARTVIDEVAAVFDTPQAGPGWSAFTSLLRTWGRVVPIDDGGFGAAARTAIERHPRAAADAYEVVAEGLLNAVKHAPAAPISVNARRVDTGAGSSLLVQVISVGARSGAAALRQDSAAARAGAWLHEEPEGVVLEAMIPLQDKHAPVVV
ncbi:hypothetical protein [Branchiibius sp. NY16-3462-2]|uniref:hypothetical protein n=1 Tax=Branchiibius sp. NY16-3462-2 TaxID=1807500 RepID=UPI00079A5201|nr:hypothetical protein [Branchiibius sp. NY16-3462-2]KYH44685.1 hypothetical protein AZH51_03360 [Branchiibius sp. NY16-3462-2]